MMLHNKKVAIIGAGPVGLTLATLLQQKGIEVQVYERDKDASARIWGGTLDLHEPSGQVVMKAAGLLERYFDCAIPMGRILVDEQANVLLNREPETGNPEINRNNLRKILLESLSEETVLWDRKLSGLEAQNGQWRLHFENQPDAIADVVIGANGGRSEVRRQITETTAAYTGTFIIQGEVREPEIHCEAFHRLCNGNILMAVHQGLRLVANPKNNGVLTYGISFRTSPDWPETHDLNFDDPKLISAFLYDKFGHWNPVYHELFAATTRFTGLPVRNAEIRDDWNKERPAPITLVGDAAHLMPPFAGEGVNTGMKDAALLFECLTGGKYETIEAAISAYEQQMKVYASEAQIRSCENEIRMHLPDFSFSERFGG